MRRTSVIAAGADFCIISECRRFCDRVVSNYSSKRRVNSSTLHETLNANDVRVKSATVFARLAVVDLVAIRAASEPVGTFVSREVDPSLR